MIVQEETFNSVFIRGSIFYWARGKYFSSAENVNILKDRFQGSKENLVYKNVENYLVN